MSLSAVERVLSSEEYHNIRTTDQLSNKTLSWTDQILGSMGGSKGGF